MITFKNLMVGITSQLIFFVYKSLINWQDNRVVLLANILGISFVERFKNIVKPFGLGIIGTKQIIFVAIEMVVVQIIQQQIELFVERWLRFDIKIECFLGF